MIASLVILAQFLSFCVAQSLTLNLNGPQIAYFDINFEVSAQVEEGLELPEVNCKIVCPGGLVSSVTAKMTSNPSTFAVRLPGFEGECEALVEAENFEPARTSLTVLGYAQCENFQLAKEIEFSEARNATFVAEYSRSGPLGSISLQEFRVSGASSKIRGEIQKDNVKQVFYENDCQDVPEISVQLSDAGTFSQSNTHACSALASRYSFKPRVAFNDLKGIQAQGAFTFKTSGASGKLAALFARICLAANYIVAEVSSGSFVPSSSLTFTAHLGLSQAMSVPAAARLTCGSSKGTISSFNLKSTPGTFTIDTPLAAPGDECTLHIYHDPEPQAYAAPVKLTLVAEALTIQVPSISVTAGTSLDYQVFVSSAPEVSTPVNVKLLCNDRQVASQSVLTSHQKVQSLAVPIGAMGTCKLSVVGAGAVEVAVYHQLTLASKLNGWISGKQASIKIITPDGKSESLTLAVSCPIGSFEAPITTGTSSSFTIPSSVSGLQCTVSTVHVPPFYLPITPAAVVIGMSHVTLKGAVHAISPGKFVGGDFKDAFGVSPIDAGAPAIGAGGAILKSANGAAGKRVKPHFQPRETQKVRQTQKRVKAPKAIKPGKQRRKY